MGRREKLIARFLNRPKDFTWDELVRLLQGVGFEEARSAGSRRRFSHPKGPVILLHKPHPSNVVKSYVLDDVRRRLTEENLL